jgi:hypothetical protein
MENVGLRFEDRLEGASNFMERVHSSGARGAGVMGVR